MFTKNRDRLLEADIATEFLARVVEQAQAKGLTSDEHFAVDGTLLEAWASAKSFQPKDWTTRSNRPGRFRIAGSRQVGSFAVATTINPSCVPTPSRQLSNVWKLTALSCGHFPSVGKARSKKLAGAEGQLEFLPLAQPRRCKYTCRRGLQQKVSPARSSRAQSRNIEVTNRCDHLLA